MVIQWMLVASVVAAFMLLSCSKVQTGDQEFESFANSYIEKLLALNPEWATGLGDHRYDALMSDYSRDGIEKELAYNKTSLAALATIDPAGLNKVNGIDYEILKHNIEAMIFRSETLREHEWNPLFYNAGGALYSLVARDFAPLGERMHSLAKRLERIPEILDAARANLVNPPAIHTETAIAQNDGMILLVRDQLAPFIEQVPELRDELVPAQQAAVEALEAYGDWLKNDLLPRSRGDFRLGEERYSDKLFYTLQSTMPMGDILGRAEADLADTRRTMYETALPLYDQFFTGSDAREKRGNERFVIQAVLGELSKQHPTNETILARAGSCLTECKKFAIEHGIVSVPDKPLDLIMMPEFKRGVAVAYCDSPGPLEKKGQAFLAISPTPSDWTPERVASFFREYNDYMVQDLTIHEAMPGHYLQLAHANEFRAPTNVRAIFGSGTFVEGWATYAEQVMVAEGYGGAPVKMEQLKMRLRMIINAIIDQKIHTAGMTEQEAMDLMMNEGFQEEGEAAGKWRRACLTSTQLSTYYVGNLEVNELVTAYRENRLQSGAAVDEKAMHDQILSYGSPPVRFIRQLMNL